jgi:predicted nuclease of predicted toxin-antitoxin system
MKLLVDMNLSPRWIASLVQAGFEAVHWSQIGAHDAPDRLIMDYARQEGYCVLTHDLDFSAILAATGGRKPSVVQIRSPAVSHEAIGQLVIEAIEQVKSELLQGALLTVDPSRSRLTLLPLQFDLH